MLKIGDPDRKSGFTLLELLVVLAIMALALAIVLAWLPQGATHADVLASAERLASGLRMARSNAIHRNRPTDFSLNPDALVFKFDDGEATKLRKNIAISIQAIVDELPKGQEGRIRFFPDGSSSGGRIELHRLEGKGRPVVITVDWLTGNVTVSK